MARGALVRAPRNSAAEANRIETSQKTKIRSVTGAEPGLDHLAGIDRTGRDESSSNELRERGHASVVKIARRADQSRNERLCNQSRQSIVKCVRVEDQRDDSVEPDGVSGMVIVQRSLHDYREVQRRGSGHQSSDGVVERLQSLQHAPEAKLPALQPLRNVLPIEMPLESSTRREATSMSWLACCSDSLVRNP
jgi:hypothetical protein